MRSAIGLSAETESPELEVERSTVELGNEKWTKKKKASACRVAERTPLKCARGGAMGKA
jgi:hypothetical protein